MATDRRTFLHLLGAGAAAGVFNASIRRALAIPAHRRTGTIADVEHIVFLMQENRSFDHYFGTLRGVRGFGDPRAVRLPSGDPVWRQPNGAGAVLPFHPIAPDLGLQFFEDLPHDWRTTFQVRSGSNAAGPWTYTVGAHHDLADTWDFGAAGAVLPFHPAAPDLGLQFFEDLPHDWRTTHEAWNGGRYDGWVPSKGTSTMAFLTRDDLPFHFALADAFTVCDAYHCSFLGPTDPNRYHMWTGWTGNDGKNGGPVLDNAEAGYDWSTYPEVLTASGISWKVYQDIGEGLDAAHAWGDTDDAFIGNFGDNSLLFFHQYQNSQPGSPLFEGALRGTRIARSGTLFDLLAQDVAANRLPQVSWIVAPEGFSEHGNWPPNFGAWYVSQVLDVLTSNPELFSKTALFLMFDENDGLFDHMVPPTPPQSRAEGLSTIPTTDEVFAGNAHFAAGPFGLGVRVPMIVISPWSKGGWVNSELFDHTSLIQFIEQRFGGGERVREPNITPWRRAVTGDLTSAFDFRSPDDKRVALPSTDAFVPPDTDRHPDFKPPVPARQSMPRQEPGVRPARAVPYELQATATVDLAHRKVAIRFASTGKAAAVFQVRSGSNAAGPWTYTVGARHDLADTWDFGAAGETAYDLSVYGPNGFFRALRGSLADRGRADLAVETIYEPARNAIVLEIRNAGARVEDLHIEDAYAREHTAHRLAPGERLTRRVSLERSFGWYDFTLRVDADPAFRRQVAGHLETGDDSMSDPLLGG